MPEPTDVLLRRGRFLYVLQASFEYLIALLVGGSFLATLTKELGFSDSLTGILSSFISLGCLFQLLSVLFRPRRVKRAVVVLSITNQLLFLLLYAIPLVDFPKTLKTALFIVFIFTAYVMYNFAHPKKINWLMSLVEDSHRGIFTAKKEIVSLLLGMVFSFGMGVLVDHFHDRGEIRIAFSLSALVLFALTVLHTVIMLFTVESSRPTAPRTPLRVTIRELVRNPSLLRITLVFVLYYIASYACTPFYGAYQIGDLGFSLTFVSALSIVSSLSRVAVSGLWGKYADKTSFASMIEKCFLVLALSFLCVALSTPSNGKFFFTLYYLLHGIAMGGINSALTNMIFDYVPYEKRADSLAVSQATAGTVGFLTTLCVSPLLSHIQKRGFTVLGISLYAQQVVTVVSLVFVFFAIAYVRFVVIAKQKRV